MRPGIFYALLDKSPVLYFNSHMSYAVEWEISVSFCGLRKS
jgi:hypothetical protein